MAQRAGALVSPSPPLPPGEQGNATTSPLGTQVILSLKTTHGEARAGLQSGDVLLALSPLLDAL